MSNIGDSIITLLPFRQCGDIAVLTARPVLIKNLKKLIRIKPLAWPNSKVLSLESDE
jgi:hypothetical protein